MSENSQGQGNPEYLDALSGAATAVTGRSWRPKPGKKRAMLALGGVAGAVW